MTSFERRVDRAEALCIRAAAAVDRLYAEGRYQEAEDLDALLEEFIEDVADRIEYSDAESMDVDDHQLDLVQELPARGRGRELET